MREKIRKKSHEKTDKKGRKKKKVKLFRKLDNSNKNTRIFKAVK